MYRYSVCKYIQHLLKVVSYYDLSVLSMSVMGFPKKKIGWGLVGAVSSMPLSSFILDFWNFFNFAKLLKPQLRALTLQSWH